MAYKELAERINKRLCSGIKTLADVEECFALDEELREFVSKASDKEMRIFKRHCFAHEAFVKIVLGLEYDKKRGTQ